MSPQQVKDVPMSKMRLAALVAVPLLWASMASAQPAPADQGTPSTPMAGQRFDFASIHKRMCNEHQARQAAHVAYIEAMLDLTEAQRPAFNKWRQAIHEAAGKEHAACLANTPKENARPTAVEREAHMEKMLAAKLQTLQATRPELEALYQALTPAQRAVFDRSFGPGHGMGPWHMGKGMGMGMEMGMGMGPCHMRQGPAMMGSPN